MRVTTRQIGIWAAAMALAGLVGCSREVEKPAESPLKDPAFRAKLTEQAQERDALASARGAIVERMTAMIEAKKKELGTDDEAKLKAALEKDPEWNELYRRCEDANTAIREQRRRTAVVVRERMARPVQKGGGSAR